MKKKQTTKRIQSLIYLTDKFSNCSSVIDYESKLDEAEVALGYTRTYLNKVLRELHLNYYFLQTVESLPGEEWKEVEGFDSKYLISNMGRLWSNSYNKPGFSKAYPNKKGYLRPNLYQNGKLSTTSIHKLVAIAFVPNPDGKDTVNHIDGDKTNNVYTNLEWCSVKENNYHAKNITKVSCVVSLQKIQDIMDKQKPLTSGELFEMIKQVAK